MKLLLDTHSFVWWRDDSTKLSTTAFNAISDADNEVFISVIAAWELEIKIALNKFQLKSTLENAIREEQDTNRFRVLPVHLAHVFELGRLPLVHRDPFDRLLIAQAIVEDLTIVTADRNFSDYDVKVLW